MPTGAFCQTKAKGAVSSLPITALSDQNSTKVGCNVESIVVAMLIDSPLAKTVSVAGETMETLALEEIVTVSGIDEAPAPSLSNALATILYFPGKGLAHTNV